MKDMYSDKDGKVCAAKTAFMVSLAVCLFKITAAGMTIGGVVMDPADYQGMATFLTPLALVYWGRNHTKAQNG